MKPQAKASVGMSEGLRGQLYQIALTMMFFTRGVFQKYINFQLETEVKNASIFDDVIFDEGCGRYRLFQLKHKTSKYKEIIRGSELFQFRGDFCLLKYVCAWILVQKEETFKGKVKDAFIFTNVALDIDHQTNTIKLQHKQKDMKELFTNVGKIQVDEVILDSNDILQVKNRDNTIKYYRFTDETVVNLLLRQVDMLKITETRQDIMKILENISVESINDALQHIVYACNQPDEEELFQIVHQEIRDYFKLHSADAVFNKLKVNLTEWIKAKTVFNHVITYEEAYKFFERNVKSIAFDITPPISSFVGRGVELKLIREMFFNSINKSAAIYGLGGVGKTQLARMYVQKYKDEDYFGRVVWINAENNNTFERSFKELAETLGITCTTDCQSCQSINEKLNDAQKSIKTIISSVIDYFTDLKVLFVLDNVEKFQITESLCYLRSLIHTQKSPPHILITSRDRSLNIGILHLALNVLTLNEACDCIVTQLNVPRKDAERLAKLLQCFPLAIQQAIAFINQQNEALKVFSKKLTINEYLSMFQTKATKLLNYKTRDDFGVYSSTTLITWDITIEAIRNTTEYGSEAIKLLQLLAFVSPNNVNPRMFLPLFDSIMDVANAIFLLEKYSMVSQNDGFLHIHRLVQKVMQLKIAEEGSVATIVNELIFILQHKFDPCHIQIQSTEYIIEQLLEHAEFDHNMTFPFGESLIHYVARIGKVDALQPLLNGINEMNGNGETPLHLACFKARFQVVKFLVENGAELFIDDTRGWTAVHRAAQGGDVQILEYLINKGANLNAKDKIGRTALHEAAMAGQINMVKFLLTQNIEIASRANNGRNVLHAAAFAGDVDMMKFLIKEGVDLFCTDHTGRSVLHSATFGGHVKTIRFLLETGFDLNLKDFDGVPPLHEAAYNGDMEVVNFLLTNGADVNAKDNNGKTALHEAALGGQIEMLEFLCTHGLNLTSADSDGRTIVHMAAIAGDVNLMQYLLTKGLSLESKDFNGRTTLHFAVANNKIDFVEYCLLEGMNINVKDNDGKTVVHWGTECRSIKMMEYLIEIGANPHETDIFGRTAVHCAALTMNVEMVKFLITEGLDITQKDYEGRTALHWASLSGSIKMIEFLLEQGLDFYSLDNHGRSTLDWAEIGEIQEAINFLSERRAKCNKNKFI